MNVLIIGMENAIFLMHPYRRNQEGTEVFLRTILTFTGKGLLFAVGLVAVMIWALASIAISRAVSDLRFAGPLLFGVGVWVALVSMAYASIRFCARLFDRLDVSQDLPPPKMWNGGLHCLLHVREFPYRIIQADPLILVGT